MLFCSARDKFTRLYQMFLLVSGRHVGAHSDGHQHGVFIQISNENFPCISCLRRIVVFFLFPDCGLYLSNGFDFDFYLF